MAGVSKNKYDVYNWIKNKVIPSCEKGNLKHHSVCNELINNFLKSYNDYKLTTVLRKLNNAKAKYIPSKKLSNLINK